MESGGGDVQQESRARRWTREQARGAGRGLLILGVVLGGAWVVDAVFMGPTDFEQAYEVCDEAHIMVYISVGDGGSSISVNGVGADSMTEAYQERTVAGLACLLDELEVSEALRQEMASTTALMGRQSATEEGVVFSWSYHPDSGMRMTMRED